jgi:hypothetical protein
MEDSLTSLDFIQNPKQRGNEAFIKAVHVIYGNYGGLITSTHGGKSLF